MEYAVNDIYEIVKWLLHTQPMTHKKLQKLLYFSYGIYLAQNNDNNDNITHVLFKDKFESKINSIVVPQIYSLYKNNGVNLLYLENIETIKFDKDIMLALNETIKRYGKFSAVELENIIYHQVSSINNKNDLSSIEAYSNLFINANLFLIFKDILANEKI